MNNEQMYKLIGDRAEELSKVPEVIAKCKEMYLSGKTIDDIKSYVYILAIATLYGAA